VSTLCQRPHIPSPVFLKGEAWIVEKAFGVKVENGTCILPRGMFRERDFIPALGQGS
jgi:hypothetical protein